MIIANIIRPYKRKCNLFDAEVFFTRAVLQNMKTNYLQADNKYRCLTIYKKLYGLSLLYTILTLIYNIK